MLLEIKWFYGSHSQATSVCMNVCVCVCEAFRDLRVSDLARKSGRKTQENVFPQRDCIQKPENCNLRYEFITWLSHQQQQNAGRGREGGHNVVQQRPLATSWQLGIFGAVFFFFFFTLGVTKKRCLWCGVGVVDVLRLRLRSPCVECCC